MSSLETTYELVLDFSAVNHERLLTIKEDLQNFLVQKNIHDFVEGCVDGLDAREEEIPLEHPELLFLATPLKVYSYEKLDLEVLLSEIQENPTFQGIQGSFSSMKTESWKNNWKEHFTPIETEEFLVLPPWLENQATNKHKIIIDPGMAFGTGKHPTTKMCLQLLENAIPKHKPKRILDLGCGSGILAIACAKLADNCVHASDIDPDAVRVSLENATVNQVIFSASTDGFKDQEPFDLIIANIFFNTLLELKPLMLSHLSKNGSLILSGILENEILPLAEAFHPLTIEQSTSFEGWGCVHLKHTK